MGKDELKKILGDSELKKSLEEKGFEEFGGFSFLFNEKEKSDKYLTLNAMVGGVLMENNQEVIINLSKIEDNKYLIKAYYKK